MMISSSIRWSLAGNEVDWMMNDVRAAHVLLDLDEDFLVGEAADAWPWSAAVAARSAISCASAGLELPATSLIEPFLADIDASPRALLDTTFSISEILGTGAFRWARRYQAGGSAGNPLTSFSRSKIGRYGTLRGRLLGAETERRDAGCILGGCCPFHTRHRGAAALGGRGRRAHPEFR